MSVEETVTEGQILQALCTILAVVAYTKRKQWGGLVMVVRGV